MKQTLPHHSRRTFLYGAAALAAAAQISSGEGTPLSGDPFHADTTQRLHFKQPASKWSNSLPVGNGRLGACVFGMPHLERIQLNEESIWDGEPNRDRDNPKARAAIPRIRELLFTGRVAEAEALATDDVLSLPRRMPCYQTLGDLHLDFAWMGLSAETPVTDYLLELDLDRAIVTTTFSHAGVRYQRETFVSSPDQVIVMRLTASEPGKLGLRVTLDRPHSFHTAQAGSQRLVMTGQALPVNDNPGLPVKENQTGVRFHAEVRLLAEGARTQLPESTGTPPAIEARGADAVTLLIDCSTSYCYPARTGRTSGPNADVLTGDPAAMRSAVERNLDSSAAMAYDKLRQRHVEDYQRLFRRVHLDLGPDTNAIVPTDVRMERIKQGGEDVTLLPLYFQFGRYMLISSSRPGTLPANLQGIWNESVDPPWGSKYTVNINAQMNYWFAESANLSECHLPLFDLLDAVHAQGHRTAQQLYGAAGVVVHHNTDIWGDAGPIDGLGGGVWAMGLNWLALHTWMHYTWSGDRHFLATRAYPLLRECVVFLLDYLVNDPKTGGLASGPSCSPENSYEFTDGHAHHLCMNPTMDVAIVRAVFACYLRTSHDLQQEAGANSDKQLQERVRAAVARLLPYRIAPDGRLQEWAEDYRDHEPGHRHISHLFGLYPDDQITVEETPQLARAARETLNRRLAAGGGSTGWSRSWILNCMARLGDGDACYANILQLFRQSTRTNLFDVCGLKENSPFQIDGNLGGPAGVIEMLLQSHGHTPPQTGEAWPPTPQSWTIRLLPALPKAWPQGSFRGLRARGGDEIDCTWAEGKLQRVTLRATRSGTRLVLLPEGSGMVRATVRNKSVAIQRRGRELRVPVLAGTELLLNFS